MVKARKRVLYQFEDGVRKNWVEFVPLARSEVPLFTHRVVIDGVAKDWLADTHKPSLKVARFFYDKYAALQPAEVKL
jgi:hypothetical protein